MSFGKSSHSTHEKQFLDSKIQIQGINREPQRTEPLRRLIIG